MKIIIPTKNRPETISTHRYFKNCEVFVVVHNSEQAIKYLEANNEIPRGAIHVSGVSADQFGLTRQREWACQNIAKKDEWFVFADDNIRDLQAVPLEHWKFPSLPVQQDKEFKRIFETHCEVETFLEKIVPECIDFAERVGANHLGFATVDNFFFRSNKWKKTGYIIGKMMLWKNTGNLQFDHTVTMEDFELTAQSIVKFGCAPVNNWVYPVAKHYEPGGMGTEKERLSDRRNDVRILMNKYPGLFTLKKKDSPDLLLKYHSEKQIESWRNQHNLLSKFRSGKAWT